MHLTCVKLHHNTYPTTTHYPFNLPIFHQTEKIAFTTPVTMFVGENGTGKSTLIEALARACGIHIWEYANATRVEVNPYEERFHQHLTVTWADGRVPGSFFGSSPFQDFTQLLDEWAVDDPGQLKYFGGKSLITQSHGQSLMSFFRSRYRIKGLYLLDEPETALSPTSQLELLNILTAMSQAGHAQFIVATHSPLLLACPGATLYSSDTAPVAPIRYEDTSHYQVYRNFLLDYKPYLK